jgi:hypothetical protein
MKSGGRAKTNATPTEQLAAEDDWLAGRHLPESFRAMLPEPSQAEQEISERVQAILSDARLVPFLRIIEQHNSRPREVPGRRLPKRDHFLLGPHLRQVLLSVQARNEVRQRLPELDQPAAEVRKHLQQVAADSKALAELIRKGPQPGIALADSIGRNEFLRVFGVWAEVFEASDGLKYQEVSLADLLERGTGWFTTLAGRVPRAPQNRHMGNGALRARAAEFLPGLFRKRLGQPYHAYVATIATIVSGIETDADFVKKVENSKQRQDGESLARKTGETLP